VEAQAQAMQQQHLHPARLADLLKRRSRGRWCFCWVSSDISSKNFGRFFVPTPETHGFLFQVVEFQVYPSVARWLFTGALVADCRRPLPSIAFGIW